MTGFEQLHSYFHALRRHVFGRFGYTALAMHSVKIQLISLLRICHAFRKDASVNGMTTCFALLSVSYHSCHLHLHPSSSLSFSWEYWLIVGSSWLNNHEAMKTRLTFGSFKSSWYWGLSEDNFWSIHDGKNSTFETVPSSAQKLFVCFSFWNNMAAIIIMVNAFFYLCLCFLIMSMLTFFCLRKRHQIKRDVLDCALRLDFWLSQCSFWLEWMNWRVCHMAQFCGLETSL